MESRSPAGLKENDNRERRKRVATRNCRFELRLTKDEFTDLTKKARKAGLTTAAFVRLAVAGKDILEAPPADVPLLIREVRRVGSNINQLLVIANTRGVLNIQELNKALAENRKVEKMISESYGMPWR